MIPFLRKIRKNLLTQNKIGQYLAYALGEIILVVVGILIALQIDQWSEDLKNKTIQIRSIHGIKENIEQDIKLLEATIAQDSARMMAYSYLANSFVHDSIKHNDSLLKIKTIQCLSLTIFSSQTEVYNDLKSSGRLGLIESDSTRFQIQRYYVTCDRLMTAQEINNTFIVNLIRESFFIHLDPNALIEPWMPENFQSKVYDYDPSFFNKNIDDPEVKNFINALSSMKSSMFLNYNHRLILLSKSKALKINLIHYLKRIES